jgi:hypothetical protein
VAALASANGGKRARDLRARGASSRARASVTPWNSASQESREAALEAGVDGVVSWRARRGAERLQRASARVGGQ